SHVIAGQHVDEAHGLVGMALDGRGMLHVLDRAPARSLMIDPVTGAQATYATFHDVAPCATGGTPGDCSAGVADLGEFPDYPVFAPDGTMYVTDLEQALIWRVPPGGGEAEVWLTDARLEGAFGPNGIQFQSDGQTLLFVQTGSQPPGTTDPGTGVLYALPVLAGGSPGELEVLWAGEQPAEGPDGFAIAVSGNLYVALAGANQLLVLSPSGQELARVPATPADNAMLPVPFDTPASVAFHGDRVLVTNQSFFAGNSASWVVYDVFAGEPGLPLFKPLPEPCAALALLAGGALLAALPRRARRYSSTASTTAATASGAIRNTARHAISIARIGAVPTEPRKISRNTASITPRPAGTRTINPVIAARV
ncbi:MAG: SMP-30/gluconolactonase/LRE family protein, partial [Myxococcota bacterium]